MALAIPLVSVSGVVLSQFMLAARARRLREQGVDADEADRLVYSPGEPTEPNYWMFGGGAAFVALTLAIGIGDIPLAQEIVFCRIDGDRRDADLPAGPEAAARQGAGAHRHRAHHLRVSRRSAAGRRGDMVPDRPARLRPAVPVRAVADCIVPDAHRHGAAADH